METIDNVHIPVLDSSTVLDVSVDVARASFDRDADVVLGFMQLDDAVCDGGILCAPELGPLCYEPSARKF